MAEIATIARPYAEAVFSIAKEENDLVGWSSRLALVQAVNADAEMIRIANDPAVSKDALSTVFLNVCGEKIGVVASHFIRLLIDANRLDILPEVVTQFEQLKAKQGGLKAAAVVSAFPLTPIEIKALTARLADKFGGSVEVSLEVNPDIIGGVIITLGDEVYDASVRGKLQDMANTLNY